jgi:Carboxypeptidase regulatory-like domain
MNRNSISLLIIATVLGAFPLAAQTSSLQGVVSDPQGAIIPGALVTLTNTETSAARKEVSDDTGAYKILQVLPGPYKIEVQKPGFKTNTSSLSLQVNIPATLNLTLEVGQVSETVNVTAEATQINTENATVGNPFTEAQVQELPLQTRNVVALLSIQPGVSSTGQVLGARADQNNVTLDGVDVNDNRGTTANNGFNAVLPIPLDSVQEFRTTIAGQGSDMGHSAGGQVSIVTKSGSNQFHGSAYEYNRNTDFEANDWFSNRAGVARPALIRNQYGASLGGPIKKNKLFFFFNWEARKDRSQASKLDTVPSDTLRQGIVQVLLKSGQTVQLSPAAVKAIDPLGLGENPYILGLMQKYPSGNDPLAASDHGLNFNDLLFNASSPLNNHAEVARMDYNIDNAGKHTLSLRGTLNGASQVPTNGLSQFPGGAPAQVTLDNSRGLAARYTYVISANLVNTMSFGYTRLGQSSTGGETVVPNFGFTTLQTTLRPSSRIAPTPNITDDLTWSKGRHTIQAGFNFHQALDITTSGSNEPSYSFSRVTLQGLGNDITNATLAYIQQSVPGAALASTSNTTNGFGAIFGLLNNGSATYNYGINGQAIPFGTSITRSFVSNSPEEYIQDTWKVKPNLTVTIGLRYSIYGVPYETNGVEVVPQTSINQYFAQRMAAAAAGIPNSAVPDANITYGLGGPLNNGPGYYKTDWNDWAPRLGIAYQPKNGTFLEKIMGKGSVLRTGAGIVYDNYGNGMAAQFASGGSPGLATSAAQVVNTNFSTGLRYDGGSTFTPLTAPAGGAFPFTPPTIVGGFTTFTSVSDDLKAPYEYVLNANYARPLPGHMSIEIGYAGRLAHRALVQQDFGQPLENFVDPTSKQSFTQAAQALAQLYYSGVTPAQVKANPSLIPNQPFAQNIMPGLANHYITGSASANLFYDAYAEYAGSWTDTINDVDRLRQTNGACIVSTGCNTFFPLQDSGVPTYTNAGKSAYNGLIVSLRRTFSNGWGFDFNYTLSHAIDNGSGSEAGSTNGSTGITNLQNAFAPNEGLGPGDYDARHQITADGVFDLPVGKGKRFAGNIPGWLDEAVGGWQVSTIYTFHTGNPLSCSSSGMYNTNYDLSSLCMLAPGATLPATGLNFDQAGIPNLFANTNVGNNLVPGYAGQVGTRGLLRGLSFWNLDMSVSKSFRLPKEGMRLTFRAEAYNLLNHENFANPSTTSSLYITQQPGLTTTGNYSAFGNSQFGEITSTNTGSAPRVLQMALRLTF